MVRSRKARAAITAAPPADEFSFMHELLSALNRLPGVRAWRQNVGTVRTGDGRMFHAGPPRGASDIVGIVSPGGWLLSIECKAGKGKRTAAQEAWAEMIGAAGGIYLCLHAKEGVEASIGAARAVIEGRRRALTKEGNVSPELVREILAHPHSAQNTDAVLRGGL